MRSRRVFFSFLAGSLLLISIPSRSAKSLEPILELQSAATGSPTMTDPARATAVEATRSHMMTLRDRFSAQVKADGFTCPLPAPAVLVEDVPSFGQYADETNTLRTTDWTLLRPEERAMFVRISGPGATEAQVRAIFEKAAHQWIFVHELGHWWQACRGYMSTHSHWEVESGANRISLAYWRENDPSVPELMSRLFHQVVDTMPSPVPAGQDVQAYFNKNYEALGPTPAYPWFQSKMNLVVFEEKPLLGFKQVLAETR